MGDMADMAIEAGMDDEEWLTDYFLGGHSDIEAYERGFIDEYGALYKTIRYKTCRCCHESGLTWGQHDGKWRLFKGDSLHQCPANPLA